MAEQDWLVTDEGQHINVTQPSSGQRFSQPYRLYRFLTDLEDILTKVPGDRARLELIRPLVRHLLTNSEWLQMNFSLPDPDTGWSVVMLYDEPDFEITVQTVAWAPAMVSPVHNHGTWGIVALLYGQEKNTFWQRSAAHKISRAGELLLEPGDILSFLPNAIHHIEALGDEPAVSFNLYGKTDYEQRFEFDVDRMTSELF